MSKIEASNQKSSNPPIKMFMYSFPLYEETRPKYRTATFLRCTVQAWWGECRACHWLMTTTLSWPELCDPREICPLGPCQQARLTGIVFPKLLKSNYSTWIDLKVNRDLTWGTISCNMGIIGLTVPQNLPILTSEVVGVWILGSGIHRD